MATAEPVQMSRSTTAAAETSTTAATTTTRIYLYGIDKSIPKEDIRDRLLRHFAEYGSIAEVFVPDRTDKPYAFLTFDDAASAQEALKAEKSKLAPATAAPDDEPDTTTPTLTSASTPSRLFAEIKPANAIRPPGKRKRKLAEDWQERFDHAKQTNVLIQVYRSHSERLSSYLESNAKQYGTVVGVLKTKSKTVSMLYFHCKSDDDQQAFVTWVETHPIISSAVSATYVVADGMHRHRNAEEIADKAAQIFQTTKAIQSALPKPTKIRLNIFPPSTRTMMIESITTKMAEHDAAGANTSSQIEITPKQASHVANVVCLDDTDGPDDQGPIYMLGVSECIALPAKVSTTNATTNKRDSNSNDNRIDNRNDNDICRAYYKLQEAMDRYPHPKPTKSLAALDCGAAPGGWTKYLSEMYEGVQIYSIDPGKLSPTVLQLNSVEHMEMTIEKSIPALQGRKVQIDVWVSDMCLKEMEGQINWFLAAKDAGILANKTFFVLTLKCVLGHSTESHDRQVEQQAKRLEGRSKHLHILHLFANRKGERTIMGYLVR